MTDQGRDRHGAGRASGRRPAPRPSLALLIALALTLLVAACGGGGGEVSGPAADEAVLVPDESVEEQPLDELEPDLPPSPPSEVADPAAEAVSSLRIDPDGASLKKGSTGQRVEQLQRSLQALGFDAGPPDGAFGDQTETAVKRFQRQNGLENDGVAGSKTIAAINNAVAAGIG